MSNVQSKKTMPSIQNLEMWVDVANVGVVIALALSFVVGGASIYLSRKLNKMKDAQSAREKQLSDEKIAATNAEAARANESAATANEGVAKADVIIAHLTKEGEALKAEAEKAKTERVEADKQIAVAKAEAAKANKQTAELSLRVEEEARKRAEAELALLALQNRLRPRSLTAEQDKILIEILSAGPKGKVTVSCVGGSFEPCMFAGELSNLLENAGWEVPTKVTSVSQASVVGGITINEGLRIQVHNKEKAPPRAFVLQNAFRQAGFGIGIVTVSDMPEDAVTLVVGTKSIL